jgi:hypothetical protein
VTFIKGTVIFTEGAMTFVGGAVTFIGGAVIFIGEAVTLVGGAVMLVDGAVTFIGKGSSAVGRLFKIAKARVVDNTRVNGRNLRRRLITYELKGPSLSMNSLISASNYSIGSSL